MAIIQYTCKKRLSLVYPATSPPRLRVAQPRAAVGPRITSDIHGIMGSYELRQGPSRETNVRAADLLKEAMAALDEAAVPPELRAAAMPAVIAHLGGTTTVSARPQSAPHLPKDPGSGDDPLDRIASGLGLDRETVSAVYHAADAGLEIVAPTSKFSPRKSAAMREITLLVVAGRQLGGYDEGFTRLEHARSACEEHKRLDGPNFAKSMSDEELTFRGSGRAREAKLSRPGREAAKALIQRLAGGE